MSTSKKKKHLKNFCLLFSKKVKICLVITDNFQKLSIFSIRSRGHNGGYKEWNKAIRLNKECFCEGKELYDHFLQKAWERYG